MRSHNQQGFIALVSAVIISVVLLTLVVGTGGRGFSSRFNILNSELKAMGSGLAEACVETARLKLAENPGYDPLSSPDTNPDWIRVDNGGCEISSVDNAGGAGNGPFTIRAHATSTPIATNTFLQIITGGPPNFDVTEWKECIDSSPC